VLVLHGPTGGVPSTVALVDLAVHALARKALAGGSRTESRLNEDNIITLRFYASLTIKKAAICMLFLSFTCSHLPTNRFLSFLNGMMKSTAQCTIKLP
jgi:hypothetical protein